MAAEWRKDKTMCLLSFWKQVGPPALALLQVLLTEQPELRKDYGGKPIIEMVDLHWFAADGNCQTIGHCTNREGVKNLFTASVRKRGWEFRKKVFDTLP